MRKLRVIWDLFVQMFFGVKIWGFPLLNRVRKKVYRHLFHIGRIDVIGNKVSFVTPHNIIGHINIGDHSDLCDEVYIDYTGSVDIENNVTLSRRVTIYSHSHDFQLLAARTGGDVIPGSIKICEGAWVGDGVIVLPNVVVGKYAVIGAGSIVTSDIPPYSIVAGNPAKIIKEYI